MTTFRQTTGIVSDNGDPQAEADVIMTTTLLGFCAWRLGDPADASSTLKPMETGPLRFDADAGRLGSPVSTDTVEDLLDVVGRVQRAVSAYLGTVNNRVVAGLAGGWSDGAAIMGVYHAVGQTAPENIAALEVLSDSAKGRLAFIADPNNKGQYTGRGAYSGFVDGPVTGPQGPSIVAGPLSTARFWASNFPQPGSVSLSSSVGPPERWVPKLDLSSPRWSSRVPASTPATTTTSGAAATPAVAAAHPAVPASATPASQVAPVTPATPIPWGVIIGDDPAKFAQVVAAQQEQGMEFVGTMAAVGVDVAMYTHGMIQAIYLAYGHGPGCRAYEIAVGSQTTKMASCIPCTFFMASAGYFPNSIHLGRGESWAPLFAPYTPSVKMLPNSSVIESKDPQAIAALPRTISDLNNSWYARCLLWMRKGLEILSDAQVADPLHLTAKQALASYMAAPARQNDGTLAGRLILDAVTMHDSEQSRLKRTLRR